MVTAAIFEKSTPKATTSHFQNGVTMETEVPK
jgi:hypothetical protein